MSRSVWNVTEDTDTSLSGTVDAAEDGLFYTSIPYENGWRAYVDGVEVPLAQTASASSESVRLTDAVIAFPLTAGQHTVELRYTAPGLKTGAIISGVSLGLFLLLALLLRRRPLFGGLSVKRRKGGGPSPSPKTHRPTRSPTTSASSARRSSTATRPTFRCS